METEQNNILFRNTFDNMTLDQVFEVNRYFRGYEYQAATYSFLANFSWSAAYDIRWDIIGEYLVVCSIGLHHEGGKMKRTAGLSMPMTKTGTYDPEKLAETVHESYRRCREEGLHPAFYSLPGNMIPILEEAVPGEILFEHDRDMDEYVYEKQKLISLSGRALHKKKNHLNYFLKTYSYEVKPLTEDMLPDMLELTDIVALGRERTSDVLEELRQEKEVIRKTVHFLDHKFVDSVGIFIDGKLEAFAIGERIGKDTAVEHFEKANVSFRGIYQAICSEFCKALPEEILFVNREEDMGLENLRQAKMALKPHHMAEKYHGKFLNQ